MGTNLVSNLSDDDNLSFILPAKAHVQTPEESAMFAELLFAHGVSRPLVDPAQPDTVYAPPPAPYDAWVAHHLRQYGFALSNGVHEPVMDNLPPAPVVPEFRDDDRPDPDDDNMRTDYGGSPGDEWYDDDDDEDYSPGDEWHGDDDGDDEDGYFPDDDVIDVGEREWYPDADSSGNGVPDWDGI